MIELLNSDPKADQLENLVALHLVRNYGLNDSVFFYRRDVEVDFYLPEREEAIQVSVELDSNPDTLQRELDAFRKMQKEIPLKRRIIVTMEEERTIETEFGPVVVVPVWKWLLAKNRKR